MVFYSDSGDWGDSMGRFPTRIGQAGSGKDPGEKNGAGGLVLGVERGDSFCGGELQWIEASDVYSSDLSAFGVGTGDLVEWAGLSPLRKNRLGICADFTRGSRADALVRALCLERSGGGDTFSGLSFGCDAFGCHSGSGVGNQN